MEKKYKKLILIFILILPNYCTVIQKSQPNLDEIFWTYIPFEIGNKKQLSADHYIFSNERRIDLFEPYIQGLKGGYIGVGTDQNLSFAAWAESEFVFLMDFDLYAVYVNLMHISILKKCENYECFLNAWNPKNKNQTWTWIEEDYKDREDFSSFKEVFLYAIEPWHVPSRWRELEFMTKNFNFQSFHNREKDYTHLHKLAIMNRIRVEKGDLTKTGTFQSINSIYRQMNLPVRILYTSNAEDYFTYNQEFRENIISIPSDELSYLVRTISIGVKRMLNYPAGEKYEDYPLHYNLQKINNMKLWMQDLNTKNILDIVKSKKDIEKGFSIVEAIPSSTNAIKTQ